MSFLQNLFYGGLLTTGFLYSSGELSKEDINELILAASKNTGNPYEEVITLNHMEEPEENIASLVGYSKIYMANIDHWTDDQWLAKLLYTERSNPKDDEELRRIAATVIHRALMDNRTIKSVCQDKKQYSGVMRKKNKHWMTDPKKIHKQVAYDMLKLYKSGIPDEFRRMYFFCNMNTVRKHNKKAYKWFITLEEIGKSTHNGQTHTFFSCKPWDKYLRKNPDARLTNSHLTNFPA